MYKIFTQKYAHKNTTTGAPDIFVVFSGIAQDDAALVLGYISKKIKLLTKPHIIA